MSSTREGCMRWQDHQDRNCMSNKKMRFLVDIDEDFRSYMRVPQEFGSHLREIKSDTIKLYAHNGCIYDIEVSREMGEIVLRSGWDVFAAAHNLEQDDYLVFKFCGYASFKVHIYSSIDGSQKITSCVHPHTEILEAAPPSTSDHYILNGNDMPFDYFTSEGSHLTKAQDKKVLEMACTIRSESPLYVAVMNKSNVDLKGCFIIIPSILMKDVREEVFKATVKLESPGSNVYSVSAAKQSDDEVVLQSGWDGFVAAHHVQEGDLIIFRHKGNSCLEVYILDPNGCQKTSSWFRMEDVSNTKEKCDDSVEIKDPPHETIDVIDLSSSSSDDDNNVAAYTSKSARRQKQHLSHCAKTRRLASTCCPSIKSEHETHEDLQAFMEGQVDRGPLNSNNAEGPSQTAYIISRKVTLSRAQEKIVLEKVQAVRSRFPIYVAVITKTSAAQKGFIMTFARKYAERCLPSSTKDLTLQLAGCRSKEWQTVLHVGALRSGGHNQVRISRGWAEFASDNHLKLGDICLFELVTFMGGLKMDVHIIRKWGERVSTGPSVADQPEPRRSHREPKASVRLSGPNWVQPNGRVLA